MPDIVINTNATFLQNGMIWGGIFNANVTYGVNIVVSYGGHLYISTSNGNVGNVPGVAATWQIMI
jgi:hypothetical protein